MKKIKEVLHFLKTLFFLEHITYDKSNDKLKTDPPKHK
jgi:hypothetical protein